MKAPRTGRTGGRLSLLPLALLALLVHGSAALPLSGGGGGGGGRPGDDGATKEEEEEEEALVEDEGGDVEEKDDSYDIDEDKSK